MPNTRQCLQCGESLPDDAPQGLCPKCLLIGGMFVNESGESTANLSAEPPPSAPLRQVHERIDRYKLLQRIGEGGCGIVYLAEQQQPVRRQVALKIIKLGMDTQQVIARFEAER